MQVGEKDWVQSSASKILICGDVHYASPLALQVIVAVLPQEFRIHGAENEARHTFRALQSTNSVRSLTLQFQKKQTLAEESEGLEM